MLPPRSRAVEVISHSAVIGGPHPHCWNAGTLEAATHNRKRKGRRSLSEKTTSALDLYCLLSCSRAAPRI